MSKNILCNIFCLFLLIFSTVYAAKIDVLRYDGIDHKYTGPEVTLTLNGEKFEVTEGLMQPIILENRTLVPVREVFETLGGKVAWDATERRVDVELGAKTISLWIDKLETTVDGKKITTDVPAKIINSKTMVPARFISEQGGLLVGWEPETKTVSINTPKAKIKNVEYTEINNIKCVVVTAETPITGYKYFMLEEPYRLILDIENSNFGYETSTKTVEDELISTIRFGNQGNNINRIVLDLKRDTDYLVVSSHDKTKLYFAMATEFEIPGEEENTNDNAEKNPEIENNDSQENNKPLDDEVKEPSGENNNSFDEEQEPSGENNNSSDEEQEPSGENNNSSDEEQEPSGETNNTSDEEQEPSGETNNTSDTNQESSGDLNNSSNEEKEPSEDKNNVTDNENVSDEKGYDDDRVQNIIVPDVYITSVKYSTVSKRIKIGYDGDIEYSDMILTNPNRIVIDIKNAELKTEGPKEINPKGSVVSGIRFSQYEEDTVRIVLDLAEKVDYKIYKRSSEIQVAVSQPTYKNISYKLNSANAQLTLIDVDLDDLTATKSSSKNRYTIKYSSKDFETGEGNIEPGDEFVEEIEITSSKIVIYDTGDVNYTIRQSGENVVVTIKKDSNKEITDKKVILIDPGHGGNDPGACNGTSYEKVYNLNISVYLYELLSERDDIVVYMSRNDDTYLNREDRVAIATELNPDFIVSVHNNSLDNKSYTGTMVLYYNNDTESQYGDVTSKECAQIVLDELLDALGTVNRGIVSRQDLHILSKTPCPSILCEVSFISNDAELERLKTKTFQKDAAEAIYDGVVKILEIM